jgi:hypothetical protein
MSDYASCRDKQSYDCALFPQVHWKNAAEMVVANLSLAGRCFELVCVPTLQSREFERAPQGGEHQQCEFSIQAQSESGI